jgi:PGF-CTERM protein
MSVARLIPFLAVALLVAVPASQAYAQPVFYFLKDAPGPHDQVPDAPLPIPLPVSTPTPDPFPGVLDPYDPKMPNAPNATTGKERLVFVGQELVLPVQFVTPENHTHADRLKGSIFVGLWAGKSGTYQANLTATLYEFPAEGDPIALANASINLDFNQSTAPDPTSFIPQNTTDPQAILFYEVGQVLPLIYHPPALFVLGPLDMPFSNTSAFGIGFSLTQGSSPVPLPAGAFASIDYDAVLSPSFIYVPWYAPDPPRATSTRSSSFGGGTSTRQPGASTLGGSNTFSGGDDDKDSPGFALPIALAALLAAAAFAARRKTK